MNRGIIDYHNTFGFLGTSQSITQTDKRHAVGRQTPLNSAWDRAKKKTLLAPLRLSPFKPITINTTDRRRTDSLSPSF